MPHTQFVSTPLLTVVETSVFARRAEKLLTEEEHEELVFYLPCIPVTAMKFPELGASASLDSAQKIEANPVE
jgi:hypothetical protein